jgi:uncharacterized protein YodC (DUF2158 family)
MAEHQWKPGDLVGMKSGGPTMTVASLEAGKVICEWFDDRTPRNGVFSPTVLEPRLSKAEGLKRMNDALKNNPKYNPRR